MKKRILPLLSLLAASLFVFGCTEKASEDKPVAEVKQDASTMDLDALEQKVADYQHVIEGKMQEMDSLKEELSKLSFTEMVDEGAKQLQASAEDLKESIDNLSERMQVYLDAAEDLKASMSK